MISKQNAKNNNQTLSSSSFKDKTHDKLKILMLEIEFLIKCFKEVIAMIETCLIFKSY